MSSNVLLVHKGTVRAFDMTTMGATVVLPRLYGLEPVEAEPFLPGNRISNLQTGTLVVGDEVLIILNENEPPEWVNAYAFDVHTTIFYDARYDARYVNVDGDDMTGVYTLTTPT